MTPTTLQALRRLLFFSRPEAARLVAAGPSRPHGVSDRAWHQWEGGDFAVPADVATNITALAAWREQAITAARAQINANIKQRGDPKSISLLWYDSPDDWATLPGRDPAMWRPHQSVCAALLGTAPDLVRLVPFDAAAYTAWLAGRTDSETQRSVWAAGLPPGR